MNRLVMDALIAGGSAFAALLAVLAAVGLSQDRAPLMRIEKPEVSERGAVFVANDPMRIKVVRTCPEGMANVDDAYCIDIYEASLVRPTPTGGQLHPHYLPVPTDVELVAVPLRNALPQAYISFEEAAETCRAAKKRLCKPNEWRKACKGPSGRLYPYGYSHEELACNDHGEPPLVLEYGEKPPRTWQSMNNPKLNQYPNGLAKTGSHPQCRSEYGVYDMVGNLHEWVDDGAFMGGYYLDTNTNGEGCDYRTIAHNREYHDYSTGFRCCADAN
jgi:formylglycine-generating enzyme